MKDKAGSMAKRVGYSIFLPILVYLALGIIRPDIYFSVSTFIMLLTQSLSYVLIGWSMLFGMSVGLFDFSVGSRVVLSALFGIHMFQYGGVIGFVLGCVVANLVLAGVTALVYASLKIPSIITGFAALLIFESIGTVYQNQFTNIVTNEMKVFGSSPGIYIISAIAFVLMYIVFNKTKFGYQIKAIGGNEQVAKSMGIKSTQLKLNTYLIGGLFLAIATMVRVGYLGTISAQVNMATMSQAFTPMMGVMIAMCLSSCNMVVGTFIGSFTITVVSSGLVALGMESRLQNVVVGVFLIVFMGLRGNSDRIRILLPTFKRTNIIKKN